MRVEEDGHILGVMEQFVIAVCESRIQFGSPVGKTPVKQQDLVWFGFFGGG